MLKRFSSFNRRDSKSDSARFSRSSISDDGTWEGYLTKRSTGTKSAFKNWRQRWIALACCHDTIDRQENFSLQSVAMLLPSPYRRHPTLK